MSSPTPPLYTAAIQSRFSSMTGGLNSISGPPSEISSIESDFSDLRTIAAGLGITELEEVYTERFKIDRTKLEEMLKCKDILSFSHLFHNFLSSLHLAESPCETMNKADWFFANVSYC